MVQLSVEVDHIELDLSLLVVAELGILDGLGGQGQQSHPLGCSQFNDEELALSEQEGIVVSDQDKSWEMVELDETPVILTHLFDVELLLLGLFPPLEKVKSWLLAVGVVEDRRKGLWRCKWFFESDLFLEGSSRGGWEVKNTAGCLLEVLGLWSCQVIVIEVHYDDDLAV